MTLTGDNGLLTRTVGAKNKTKLAEAQEIASLEYTARLIDSRVDATSISATAESIADVLEDKGFTVKDKQIGESTNTITGVSLLDGTTPVTTLNLNTGEEKTLKVSTTTNGGNANTEWYVQIDDKWHKIEVGENGVEIAKNGVASLDTGNNTTPQTITISVTGMPENPTASVKKLVEGGEDVTIISGGAGVAVVKNDEIKITAGTSNLTGVTITVSVANVTPLNVGLTVTKIIGPTAAQIAAVRTNPVEPTDDFKRDYGLIDVIWIDRDNNKISATNYKPMVDVPSGLTPIKYKADLSGIIDSSQTYTTTTANATDWYNYDNNEWANAVDANGSFFVWIPRYAYRITYYDKDPTDANSGAKITGYYDGNGLWSVDANENVTAYYALEDETAIKTITDDGKKYIVHPAFEASTEYGGGFTTNVNGQNKKIAGIWVAKYEMSMENGSGQPVATTSSTIGNVPLSATVKAVSKPCTSDTEATGKVSSWSYITIGNCYANSKSYNTNLKSHLMKNSEWGAVAYLTHSQYGRNGEEIAINNSSDGLTGNSGGATDSTYVAGISNYYYSTNGVKASSTGNITGIYDLSGGAFEYVAAYNNKQDSNNDITNNGWTDLTPTTVSDEYATQYNNNINPEVYNGIKVYTVGKTGDATKEVYAAKDVTSGSKTTKRNWFDDSSFFVYSSGPFFVRGGGYSGRVGAGVFASTYYKGAADSSNLSFRVVLVP